MVIYTERQIGNEDFAPLPPKPRICYSSSLLCVKNSKLLRCSNCLKFIPYSHRTLFRNFELAGTRRSCALSPT